MPISISANTTPSDVPVLISPWRCLRHCYGLSQPQVAEAVGIAQSYYSRIERRAAVPGVAVADKLWVQLPLASPRTRLLPYLRNPARFDAAVPAQAGRVATALERAYPGRWTAFGRIGLGVPDRAGSLPAADFPTLVWLVRVALSAAPEFDPAAWDVLLAEADVVLVAVPPDRLSLGQAWFNLCGLLMPDPAPAPAPLTPAPPSDPPADPEWDELRRVWAALPLPARRALLAVARHMT